MNRGIVSGRYAKALFMHAEKHGKELEVYRETKWLSRCMVIYPQVKRILANPIISASKKLAMLEKLYISPLSGEFRNFLRLVLENKREELLQTMCFVYKEYYREAKQILHIDFVTATETSEEIKIGIIEKMKKLTNKNIRLSTKVDPEILGGYILYWDTYRWDVSVASRIRNVERKIRETLNNI